MSFYPYKCELCGASSEIWRRPSMLGEIVPCVGSMKNPPCGGPMFLQRHAVQRGSVAEEMLLARELERVHQKQQED